MSNHPDSSHRSALGMSLTALILAAAGLGCTPDANDLRCKGIEQYRNRQYFESMATLRYLLDFEADDELYAKLVGDAKIDVLVEAYSDWSKTVEPLAWTLGYGKGRVFNIVFGHDVKACSNPNFATLLQRGTEWVATSADQVSRP